MKNNFNANLYDDILKNTEFSVPDIHLPYSEDFPLLSQRKMINGKTVFNRIC
jgi:hypothetical protein